VFLPNGGLTDEIRPCYLESKPKCFVHCHSIKGQDAGYHFFLALQSAEGRSVIIESETGLFPVVLADKKEIRQLKDPGSLKTILEPFSEPQKSFRGRQYASLLQEGRHITRRKVGVHIIHEKVPGGLYPFAR
jgi:hypothetical protein